MQALFLHTMWVDNGIMFSDSWAMRFLCVASAAHFLFYGGITMSFSENFKKQEKTADLRSNSLQICLKWIVRLFQNMKTE